MSARRIAGCLGLAALAGLALVGLAGLASAQAPPDWSEAEPRPVVEELPGPIDLAIAPDGELWWNEFYSGNVTRWHPDESGPPETVFHADPIEDPVERGLLGLALDPDDPDTFYVYYTVPDPEDPAGGTNHLSRIANGEETQLLTVPAHQRHNGGRITFDDEGRLFVSTGDNTQGHPAQDPSSRLGKILHLHPNGTPAEDTIEGYTYSIGHRNVYGLAYDEATGRLFATENGASERDEVNRIQPGHNYGWPECQGTVRYDFEAGEPTEEPCPEDYEAPIGEFYPNYTSAPTAATVHEGDLYWAAWNQGEIHRMRETADGWRDRIVFETDGRINDLTTHDGTFYFANWTAIIAIGGLYDDAEGPGARLDDGTATTDGTDPVALAGASLAGAGLAAAAALARRR
jgi:glucose/arabinose dehydrogenase